MAVTPSTIAVELGRAAPAGNTTEYDQWEQWIKDALMLIEARLVGENAGQVASLDELDEDKLDYVVRLAVADHVKRPDDATEVNVRVDDGSMGKTYRSSAGRVTIRDEWWDLLAPDGKSSAGAFSIRPSGCGTSHLPWCSLMMGAAFCSCGVDIAGEPIYELDENW